MNLKLVGHLNAKNNFSLEEEQWKNSNNNKIVL